MATHWRRVARVALGAAGLLGCGFILMGITGIPRGVARWFTTEAVALESAPRTIVVLGGDGIPSESGLMRTYCAAQVGRRHPGARVVCSLPTDGDPDTSSVGRMRDELVLRGIPREAVALEYRAHNTREQALAVRDLLGADALDQPLLLVTSPSHARRALLCFRKAGFRRVACAAAMSTSAEADMGHGVFLRYGFWNTLVTQIHFARELVAMAYYKARGWI